MKHVHYKNGANNVPLKNQINILFKKSMTCKALEINHMEFFVISFPKKDLCNFTKSLSI